MVRIKILAVEDDLATRTALLGLFADGSYEVTHCRSAEAALCELRRGAFDVVLADDRLPGHTGTWMATRALDEGLATQTRFVLLSEDPSVRGSAKVTVVRKPFGSQGLMRIIARSLPN
jgi:CheY-like chemotaxis protein